MPSTTIRRIRTFVSQFPVRVPLVRRLHPAHGRHDGRPRAQPRHFLPGKIHHAAETKAETFVQVDGIGPFDIDYLNPADNPNKAAAMKK
jgi:hypothetical protein